jgi:NADP-reducing hydrogenase subunit HndC
VYSLPCRHRARPAILTDLSLGQGEMRALDELAIISQNLATLSNCGLGQTAGTPISDILNHFRAEVEAHVRLKVCPTGVCPMHVPERVHA